MNKTHSVISDTIFTGVILAVFFLMSLIIEAVFGTQSLIPAILTLAVFLISLTTEGYAYGIAASLVSVLALNFAFTFPYFKFNFSIPENLVSAVIMLVITIMSSALATKVTKQEKLRVESEKERMRANLLRAVSHDLRTPLTTIYGSSSAIIDGLECLSNEQICQLASGIKEDSEWLMRMVENLLSITKIDNTGVKLRKTDTVLEELIDIVLIKFKKSFPNQQVKVDIPEDFIIIPMDAMLIEQVLVNILENAVRHAKGMTELWLRVYVEDDQAIFEVIDDGCGIEKERIGTVFKGYYEKKKEPIDNQKSNMGIGLSVCASIIKAHEGTISVENRATGGCIFRFILDMETEINEQ